MPVRGRTAFFLRRPVHEPQIPLQYQTSWQADRTKETAAPSKPSQGGLSPSQATIHQVPARGLNEDGPSMLIWRSRSLRKRMPGRLKARRVEYPDADV